MITYFICCLIGHDWNNVRSKEYEIINDLKLTLYGVECSKCKKRGFNSRIIIDNEITRKDWK